MGASDPVSDVRDDEGPRDDSVSGAATPAAPEPAPAYPPVPPPPLGYQQQWGAPAAPFAASGPVVPAGPKPPRSRTALIASLAAVGFLAIVAGTAATVVALGSPSGGSVAQAAAPGGSAKPSASASASASASPAAPATSAPVVVPTVAPSPTSTVKGTVDGDSHRGDLRFFLLPVPSGGQPINDTDGTLESLSVLSKEMASPSQGLADLKSWNCTGGATREYRSSDGTLTIRTELLHFADSSDADGWASGLNFSAGSAFSVPGIGDGRGWAFNPSDSGGFGSVIGASHVGDVMYEIEIDGTGKIAHSLLTPLMTREEQLLRTGH